MPGRNLALNKRGVIFQQRQQFFQLYDWWVKNGVVAQWKIILKSHCFGNRNLQISKAEEI